MGDEVAHCGEVMGFEGGVVGDVTPWLGGVAVVNVGIAW